MAKRFGPDDLEDRPGEISLSEPTLLARSYLDFERYDISLHNGAGEAISHRRDMLRIGPVVAVLALDPIRDEIVLLRQFRLGAHLAGGRGEMIEVVAGPLDPGEDPVDAARRECQEEIGVAPLALVELFTFMPAPGFTDEYAKMYLATVDAAAVPERAGLIEELEQIVPMRVSIDDALAALDSGRMINGYLLHALHWLALNRRRIGEIIGKGSVTGA